MRRLGIVLGSASVFLILPFVGCSGDEKAIAGPGEIKSLEARPSLSNPLKAPPGPSKGLARRTGAIQRLPR